MENPRSGFLEIKVVPVPKCIRAARMKKRPAAMTLLGHHVSIRSGRFGCTRNVPGVNLVRFTGLENFLAERIFAHQTCTQKWKRNARFGQIDQYIVGCATGPLGLAADVAKLLGLGIDIDQFDLVDDPVAACEQAATTICGQFIHIGSTEAGTIDEGEEVSAWKAIYAG